MRDGSSMQFGCVGGWNLHAIMFGTLSKFIEISYTRHVAVSLESCCESDRQLYLGWKCITTIPVGLVSRQPICGGESAAMSGAPKFRPAQNDDMLPEQVTMLMPSVFNV
jgi:hypothetical protein